MSSFVRFCHYDVFGLEPNRKYNFRVRAENQYGVSEPVELDNMITAKFPFTVPDPPGRPQVIDWDTSNATLQWERPVHDGGSKIQGYKIEIRFVYFLLSISVRLNIKIIIKSTLHNSNLILRVQFIPII